MMQPCVKHGTLISIILLYIFQGLLPPLNFGSVIFPAAESILSDDLTLPP